MTKNISDIIIIGGGISGTAAAYELARTGANVTLLEKGSLASMASGWTLAGVRQSGRHPAELPLAKAAIQRWVALNDELEADVLYRQDGNLRLAHTPEEMDFIANMVTEQKALGLDLEFLADTKAVRAVAPALSDEVLAASICPTDGHADPIATVQAFAEAAKRHGAKILTQTIVTGIEQHGGRVTGVQSTSGPIAADMVVVTAGIHSGQLCQMLGLTLPITVKHVSVLQTAPLPSTLKQVLGVASANFACRQEVDGYFRMTSGSEDWVWPGGWVKNEDIQPTMGTIATIIQRACRSVPALQQAPIKRTWGGLLDMTPDGLPVIERRTDVAGLIIAAGFSGHGFCLGPITGQIIRELVIDGQSSLPIKPFELDRFMDPNTVAKTELLG